MNYPILQLNPKRERSILLQHPWIFSGAVQKLPKKTENGDIIAIHDSQSQLLGYGFYAPNSQITCRMFHFGKEPIEVDEDFWIQKIQKAYNLRKNLVLNSQTTAYRLLHAEGDFIPGVIVDVYGEVAVVQILIKGTEKIHQAIIKGLQNIGIQYIYLKTKENSKVLEQMELTKGWLTNPYDKPVEVFENNLKFLIDIEKGQKTGFFLDQRENRDLVRHYAANKTVLNAFSYTSGFSVYALAGNAKHVTSVDISADAVAQGDKIVQLNFPETTKHTSFSQDCFEFLKKDTTDYDMIVLDPPAFAKNAKAVQNAARGYKELNMLGMRRIKSGGLIFTFSCSGNIDRDLFRKIVFGAAADVGRNVRILHQLTQPTDHPINIYHPEGEYLKGLVLYVE